MTPDELQALRARLNAGPVVFCRDFLGVAYNTGRHYLNGTRAIPGPVAQVARMWGAALDAGRAEEMKAALGITGEPKPYKRKPKVVDLSFLDAKKGTGYTEKRG